MPNCWLLHARLQGMEPGPLHGHWCKGAPLGMTKARAAVGELPCVLPRWQLAVGS